MKKVFFYTFVFCLIVLIVYLFLQPRITFVDKEIHLALYQEVEPLQYIEKLSHIEEDEIKIDNQVDNSQLGQYKIVYSYHQKVFTLIVYVDDMLPPQFETQNKTILKDETISAKELVKNIRDDSKTEVYFQQNYTFHEVKTYKVVVVVEDSYGNKSEKSAYVQVQAKDEQPPVVSGLTPITLLIGDEIDLKKDICYQIDYINEQGKDILNGSQAKNRLKSVKNAAFTYEYDLSETDNVESVNGIPVSPFASIHIRTELNKQGYFNRLVDQCHHRVF